MSRREDEIAEKAVRKSTLKSLKEKKRARLKQLKAKYEDDLREIEIEYAEDPERLKARYASEEYAKTERAKKIAERKIARAKKEINLENQSRRFTFGEELFSSIVQGIGAALFIAGLAILETLAIKDVTTMLPLTVTLYALFGSSMILMYIFSVLSHSLTNGIAKDVFRRLSHSCSYLVIGFCYSAYALIKVQGWIGWTLFGCVWGICLIGTVFYSIFSSRIRKLHLALYAISGFSGLIICKLLFQVLPAQSFHMLVASLAFYIVGFLLYCLRNVKFMHAIGNIILLGGNIFVFFSMFFINR